MQPMVLCNFQYRVVLPIRIIAQQGPTVLALVVFFFVFVLYIALPEYLSITFKSSMTGRLNMVLINAIW